MLKKLISECSDYDYKVALEINKPRSWLKTVSAFANGIGGSLFFGIDDNGTAVGLDDIKVVSDKVSELIRARIDPIPVFLSIPHEIDGVNILEIAVQPGFSTPYYYRFDGITVAYVRNGNETIEVPTHILNELILKGMGQTFDSVLTGDSFDNYAFSILKSKFFNRVKTEINDIDLVSYGLVKDGYLTRAGLLFADENRLLQSRLFCTRWKGTDKVSENDVLDDDEISGSLIKQYDAAMDFYKKNIKKPWHKEDDGTVWKPEYEELAVSEALINAIVHRDYNNMGAEVCLNMYDDRMEITSPGMMLSGRKIPEKIDFQIESSRRNPILADIFNRLGLMNRRGSGLSNITRLTNALFDDGENHVRYKCEGGFFTVAIDNARYTKDPDDSEKKAEETTHNVGLTSNEYRIYTALKENPRLSYDEIAKETGLSRRTVARNLSLLSAKNYIGRKGSVGKGGYWETLN